MCSNKVKYGLKNVHYAVISEENGIIKYEKPKKILGAVKLQLSPEGDQVDFYADDRPYFVSTVNQGYSGSIEFAIIPDEFRKDVLGEKTDSTMVLFENADQFIKNIALLFEFSGDCKNSRHVLLNVSVSRPSIESSTKGKSIEIKTETLNIKVSPRADGFVKAKAEPGYGAYEKWYDSVYEIPNYENKNKK